MPSFFYYGFGISRLLGFKGPRLALGGIRLTNLDSVSWWICFQIHLANCMTF